MYQLPRIHQRLQGVVCHSRPTTIHLGPVAPFLTRYGSGPCMIRNSPVRLQLRCTHRETLLKIYSEDQLHEAEEWIKSFTPDDIPQDAFQMRFTRSSGPGGQNVNKVNTKAEIRFHVASASWLPQYTRDTLQRQEASRINKSGELVLSSVTHRTQAQNKADCFKRLARLIAQASEVPKETSEQQREHVKRMERIANERRLEEKRRRKEIKSRKRNLRDRD